MTTIDIETPRGLARAHLYSVDEPRAALVIGHGAGGGVNAPDIQAATRVANEMGVSVALIEQPYRVAGRRAPAPAKHLDEALIAIVEYLRSASFGSLPVILGGRSMGARVACRVSAQVRAIGVLCLAFPLQPPARSGKAPAPDRLPELAAVTVPVLIVQGDRDPFGMPPAAPQRTIAVVPGDHSLKRDLPAVGDAVRDWLNALLA